MDLPLKQLLDSAKKRREDHLFDTVFELPFDEKAVDVSIQKQMERFAERDKKTKEWNRFVVASDKGLRDSLKNQLFMPPLVTQTGAPSFWDEIVDSYIGSYRDAEYIPYEAKSEDGYNTPELFANHVLTFMEDEEYRTNTLRRFGYPIERVKEVNKNVSLVRGPAKRGKSLDAVNNRLEKENALREWLFGEATELPMLTILGKKQKELRKQRLEGLSRSVGRFKLSPLPTRDETNALAIKPFTIEKVGDVDAPKRETTFAEVVSDKWDSQLEYGTLPEIVNNAITQTDQFARSFPADPNFDFAQWPEFEDWTKKIGNSGFADRLIQSKSYAEAEAAYLAALDEITKAGRAQEFFDFTGGSVAEFALDMGIGIAGDPVGTAIGFGEGALITKGIGALIKGNTKKAILGRFASEVGIGAAEGVYFMDLYAKNTDPTRAETDILTGATTLGLIGAGFELALGETRTALGGRIRANRLVSRIREAASAAESLNSPWNVDETTTTQFYAGIPLPPNPFERLRRVADEIEKAGEVSDQSRKDLEDAASEAEEFIISQTYQPGFGKEIDVEVDVIPEYRAFIIGMIEEGRTKSGRVVDNVVDEAGNPILDLQGKPVKRYQIEDAEVENLVYFKSAVEAIDPELGENAVPVMNRVRFNNTYRRLVPAVVDGKESKILVTKESLLKETGIEFYDLDDFIAQLFTDENGNITEQGRIAAEGEYVSRDVAIAVLASIETRSGSIYGFKQTLGLLRLEPAKYGELVKEGLITESGTKGLLDFHNNYFINRQGEIVERDQPLNLNTQDLLIGRSYFFRKYKRKKGQRLYSKSTEAGKSPEQRRKEAFNSETLDKQTSKQQQETVQAHRDRLAEVENPEEFQLFNRVLSPFVALRDVPGALPVPPSSAFALAHLRAMRLILGDPRVAKDIRIAGQLDDPEQADYRIVASEVSKRVKEYYADWDKFVSYISDQIERETKDVELLFFPAFTSPLGLDILAARLRDPDLDPEIKKLFNLTDDIDFETVMSTLSPLEQRKMMETLLLDFSYRAFKGDIDLTAPNLVDFNKRHRRKFLTERYKILNHPDFRRMIEGENPDLASAIIKLSNNKNLTPQERTALGALRRSVSGDLTKLKAYLISAIDELDEESARKAGFTEEQLESFTRISQSAATGLRDVWDNPGKFADDAAGVDRYWETYAKDVALFERRVKQGALGPIKDVTRVVKGIERNVTRLSQAIVNVNKYFKNLNEQRKKYQIAIQKGDLNVAERQLEKVLKTKERIRSIFNEFGVENLAGLQEIQRVQYDFLRKFSDRTEKFYSGLDPQALAEGLRELASAMKNVYTRLTGAIKDIRKQKAVASLTRVLDHFTKDLGLANEMAYRGELEKFADRNPDRVIPDDKEALAIIDSLDSLIKGGAAFGRQGAGPWGVTALDGKTNPFRGRNKVFSRVDLQNWIVETNEMLKGMTGFSDLLENVDLKKLTTSELVNLSEDLILGLKKLESIDLLETLNTPEYRGTRAIFDALNIPTSGRRHNIYNQYARFISLSDRIGVPEQVKIIYSSQLTGREKLIPLNVYLRNNPHLNAPDVAFYLKHKAQNTPNILLGRSNAELFSQQAIVDIVTRLQQSDPDQNLTEILTQKRYLLNVYDEEVIDKLGVLSLKVEDMLKRGKSADEVRTFLGEIGVTGLPKKIENIILPSSNKTAWKSFIRNIKSLPEEIGLTRTGFKRDIATLKEFNNAYMYLDIDIKDLEKELQKVDPDSYLFTVYKNRLDELKKQKQTMDSFAQKQLDEMVKSGQYNILEDGTFFFRAPTYNELFDSITDRLSEVFDNYEKWFDATSERWARSSKEALERGEQIESFFTYHIKELNQFLQDINQDMENAIQKDLARGVQPQALAVLTNYQNLIQKLANNIHVLSGFPEPYPKNSVNIFRLDLISQLPVVLDPAQQTFFSQSIISKLQQLHVDQRGKLIRIFEDGSLDLPDSDLTPEQIRIKTEATERANFIVLDSQKGFNRLQNSVKDTVDDAKAKPDSKVRELAFNSRGFYDDFVGTPKGREAFIENFVKAYKEIFNAPESVMRDLGDDLRIIAEEALQEFETITNKVTDSSFGLDPEEVFMDPELGLRNVRSIEASRKDVPTPREGLKMPKSRRGRGGRKRGSILNPIEALLRGFGKIYDWIKKAASRRLELDVDSIRRNTTDAQGRQTARGWLATWGAEIGNPSTGSLGKILNFLRSARGRANANQAGMIRKLGQMVFGSELAVVGKNKVSESRAAADSPYEAVRMGVVKYRTRVFAKLKQELEDLRNKRKIEARKLDMDEREFDAVVRNVYNAVRQAYEDFLWNKIKESGQLEVPAAPTVPAIAGQLPEEVKKRIVEALLAESKVDSATIKKATNEFSNSLQEVVTKIIQDLRDGKITVEGVDAANLTDAQLQAIVTHILDLENVKNKLKELLPDDDELVLALDSKNAVNALDSDSFRDMEFALQAGEVERVVGDSLVVRVGGAGEEFDIIKSPLAKAVLGQIIYKKIKSGARGIIFNVGTYTKKELRLFMKKNLNMEDLKALYPDANELDGLSEAQIREKVINELFGDSDSITIRVDRDKKHNAKLREGFKDTLEYSRLKEKGALGGKVNQNRLEEFSINDIAKADTIDDVENIGQRVIDRKVETDVLGDVNRQLEEANVVDENGKPKRIKTIEELFTFFEDSIDELYKMGVITETSEARNMLAYMKTMITGRDPKDASRAVGTFIRMFQKAATAMSAADFSIAAIPELVGILLRSGATRLFDTLRGNLGSIKDFTSEIKSKKKEVDKIKQKLDNAVDSDDIASLSKDYEKARKELDDLERKQGFLDDIIYSAGIGTEGALYRNTGSNRRSVIFDSENPLFNPAYHAKTELGKQSKVDKATRLTQKQLESMATRAADGELIPALPLSEGVGKLGKAGEVGSRAMKFLQRMISLNGITGFSQKIVFNTMASRLLRAIDDINLDDFDLNTAEGLRELANEVMDPVLAAQLGMNASDVSRLALSIKEVLKSDDTLRSKKLGTRVYDLGSILNHPKFDPDLREKFTVAMYNWIGQNVVRPDAGDLPLYVSNAFVGMLLQFRSFGMAQYHKSIAPALQRVRRSGWSEKGKALGGALGTTVAMGAIYQAFNYYVYNKEEVDEDIERFGSFENYLKACYANSLVGKMTGAEPTYIKPKTNILVPFSQGISDPFMGQFGPISDVAIPTMGIDDPFSWYDKPAYGGKYGMAEDILRTSAAFRAGADVVDPGRRALSGKSMDDDYWMNYAAKLSGRNRSYRVFQALLDVEE